MFGVRPAAQNESAVDLAQCVACEGGSCFQACKAFWVNLRRGYPRLDAVCSGAHTGYSRDLLMDVRWRVQDPRKLATDERG